LLSLLQYNISPEKLFPDEHGYLPVDFDDPDYFHCSELDDLPTGRLYKACGLKEDRVDLVEKELRLDAYPEVVHWKTQQPLVQACTARNNSKSVKFLVDRGASLAKTNSKGWNNCQAAAFEGYVDSVKICYENGVDLVSNTNGAQ
jgi:ankyrin repeat protein